MGIYALLYIYRSAKFGVVVFKASMLDCKGGSSAMGICPLFYIYRSAKFGVVAFRASMPNWLWINLPWVYVHCFIYIYIDLPSLV